MAKEYRFKFSLIIGLFNQSKTLPKLIESLESQTFKDFEVIFCDDKSDDGTKEFFKRYSFNFRWHYHRLWLKQGMQLSKNLNQGIKKAKGEYCVFIMGDSFPELNYLEVLNEYTSSEKILCGIRVQVENKRVIEMDWRLRKNIIPPEVVLLPDEPHYKITGNGLCIPMEAMRKYGGWNERIRGYGGDDNELVARLYYKGYLVWSVPQAILYHNWHIAKVETDKQRDFVRKLIKSYGK